MSARRRRTRDTLNELSQQLGGLALALETLSAQRRSLRFRLRTLTAWLECLAALEGPQHAAADPLQAASSSSGHVQAAHDELQRQQADLVLLLVGGARDDDDDLQPSERSTQPLFDGDPLQQPIAPPDDPLAFFRDLVSRPQPPGVEEMTALQYVQQHRDVALELGMLLHLLQQPAMAPTAFSRIKQRLDRHYHVMLSLILAGKLDVAEAPKMFNLAQMQPLSADCPADINNQDDIQATLLPALNLSEAQEDRIAHAVELCESLMAPVVQEIAHLQLLLHQQWWRQQQPTTHWSSRRSRRSSRRWWPNHWQHQCQGGTCYAAGAAVPPQGCAQEAVPLRRRDRVCVPEHPHVGASCQDDCTQVALRCCHAVCVQGGLAAAEAARAAPAAGEAADPAPALREKAPH